MEKRPLVYRLFSRRLILFHIAVIVHSRFLCQILLLPDLLGFRALYDVYRFGAVRFLHLRSGTFLLLPDDLLLIVLAEIYHEALLRWRGINVGQSVETSEDNQGCVENHGHRQCDNHA